MIELYDVTEFKSVNFRTPILHAINYAVKMEALAQKTTVRKLLLRCGIDAKHWYDNMSKGKISFDYLIADLPEKHPEAYQKILETLLEAYKDILKKPS